MADATVVHIGENSPEKVAYGLMMDVVPCEGRKLHQGQPNVVNRKWLLDTYAECLEAVKGHRTVPTP